MVTVYEFEGTRRFAHPGWVETPERVREDYGTWRKATGQNDKAVCKWLLARGYRQLNLVGRTHDGSLYRSWWGLVSVFGEPVLNECGRPMPIEPAEIRSKYEHWREAKLMDAQGASMAMRLGRA